MPDVSVIIPAWNAQAFIGRSVAAALAQTGVEVEVIVADDASTDRTGEVVTGIGDPRVKYLRQARNGGPAAARNAAFAAASADWLLILDADDDMTPGRAALLLETAKVHKADIVADNLWIADQDDLSNRRLHLPETLDGATETYGLADYIARNRLFQKEPGLGYLKPMFSRFFLGRHGLAYEPDMRIGEDYALVAEALAYGARYVRRRSADYIYLTRAGSISHRLKAPDLQSMIAFDLAFLEKHAPRLSPAERTAAVRHLGALRDGAAFTEIVDALKARRPAKAAAAAIGRPAALALLAMPIRARVERWRSSTA